MSHKTRLGLAMLAVVVAIGMMAPVIVQAEVNEIKYSYTPSGGKAFWVPVHLFAARSANYGPGTPATADFVEDPVAAATGSLSGHAMYFPLQSAPNGTMNVNAYKVGCGATPPTQCPTEQANAWVEYQIQPGQLPPAFATDFGSNTTWYFHTLVQQPTASGSGDWNMDSNNFIANGHPAGGSGVGDLGDFTSESPTDADWYAAANVSITGTQKFYDRICNDLHAAGATAPVWKWIGTFIDPGGTGTYRLLKKVNLIGGKFTYRIFEAEASNWNARLDVMCWTTDANYWPTQADFDNAHFLGDCLKQNEPTGFSPTSGTDASNTTITITGTNLDIVSGVKLVRLSGGPGGTDIIGTIQSQSATSLTVLFPTQGAVYGSFRLTTLQDSPCLPRPLADPLFVLNCSTATEFSSVEPNTVLTPNGPLQFRLKGANVKLLTSVKLVYANDSPSVDGTGLFVDGEDLLVFFNLSCDNGVGGPAGPWHLQGTREAACTSPAQLSNAVWVVKPPTGNSCVWQPWAAAWSNVNQGADLNDPNKLYDPTNWDYDFGQATVLGTTKDTPPDGGARAFHFFWDNQPPDVTSSKAGSGGIYQEISVTPGVPIKYSYWWKGNSTAGTNIWYELLLIDGPFNLYYADGFQESTRGYNNPAMVRKTTTVGEFPWTQVTDETAADPGSYGPRPQTITPTNSVVTVVFKAGRLPGGALELFIDNIEVSQNGGSNLVLNGTFEAGPQVTTCNHEWMFQDSCEANFWRRSLLTPPSCPNPFADSDGDSDVDQMDFAAFQLCYAGQEMIVDNTCRCFDWNGDSYINQMDANKFELCASGPGIAANPLCDD
jgi:hypothetical protein